MSMFCYQCQEARGNTGCAEKGKCGKTESTSNLQDLLIYTATGVAIYAQEQASKGHVDMEVGRYINQALFVTITNANFDDGKITDLINRGLMIRETLQASSELNIGLHDCVTWTVNSESDYLAKAESIGILETENEDIRSLRALLTYGIKGMVAYAEPCSRF
ncbi:hypothetical protein ACLKMH_10965 [Psychromonas sp. KJ10-10]|uniref:hypothetical protein n=1 Tax=Psychromonas sp. KJ10-10 TaxID=3391823 RepID=UPI0039B4FEDE